MSAVRRWFVTGASRGLGRALTEVVLDRRDRVVAAVRRPESVADLEQKYGSQIEVEQLDVSDLPAIDEVLGRVLARGPLDVVVNNAGFGVIGALEDQSPELVQSQLTTMLHAPIAITRAVLPALREHGGGGDPGKVAGRDPRPQHPGEPAAAGPAGQRRLRRVVRHAAGPHRRARVAGDARAVRGDRSGSGRILSHRVRSAAPAPTPW
ncbi:SDR family NAD(P)-dependent oxidoreductase [Amycolatopsis sp. NPDC051372]|uniref:SDR family NAD(P)-dependent oxidoreductase n=1 Tax=Amycolatopsis sp. NPDC051372 TaxID=3155669 RepID=UPI00343EDE4B